MKMGRGESDLAFLNRWVREWFKNGSHSFLYFYQW